MCTNLSFQFIVIYSVKKPLRLLNVENVVIGKNILILFAQII